MALDISHHRIYKLKSMWRWSSFSLDKSQTDFTRFSQRRYTTEDISKFVNFVNSLDPNNPKHLKKALDYKF